MPPSPRSSLPPGSLPDGIGAFAERGGVKPDTVRYYERIGLLPKPARDGAGRRRYGEQSERRLELVRTLRAAGLSIAEIRHVLGAKRPGRAVQANAEAVARALADVRESLERRRAALQEAVLLLDQLIAEAEDAAQ